jgi:hypothetical protein
MLLSKSNPDGRRAYGARGEALRNGCPPSRSSGDDLSSRAMKTVNGMPADHARDLDDLASEACAKLEAIDPGAAYAALTSLPLSVGTSWTALGTSMTYEPPSALFPTQARWVESLAARTREAKTTGAALLAVLDPAACAPIFRKVALLETENSHQVSYEGGLVRAFWSRWEELLAHLPPSFAGELALRGKFDLSALTQEQLAALPLAELCRALDRIDLDADDTERLLARPELREPAARLAFLEQVLGPSWERRQLAQRIVWTLAKEGHPESGPWAARLFDMDDRNDPGLVSLAIATRCEPVLHKLWGELAQRRKRAKPRWDPHHTDLALQPAIRAGFALDPARASERFAPFFTAEAAASDEGAKVCHDVWMIGMGHSVRHGSNRLDTAEGDLLSADRGWYALAARHLHHPRLGRMATQILKRLPKAERNALLHEHAGSTSQELAPRAPPAKKPSAKATKIAKKR